MPVSPTTAWHSFLTDLKVSLETPLTDKSPSTGLAVGKCNNIGPGEKVDQPQGPSRWHYSDLRTWDVLTSSCVQIHLVKDSLSPPITPLLWLSDSHAHHLS